MKRIISVLISLAIALGCCTVAVAEPRKFARDSLITFLKVEMGEELYQRGLAAVVESYEARVLTAEEFGGTYIDGELSIDRFEEIVRKFFKDEVYVEFYKEIQQLQVGKDTVLDCIFLRARYNFDVEANKLLENSYEPTEDWEAFIQDGVFVRDNENIMSVDLIYAVNVEENGNISIAHIYNMFIALWGFFVPCNANRFGFQLKDKE